MIWWQVVLVILISYFIGNLSFARFISKSIHSDVTKLGSGNPGSTNMLRNFGFKIGLLTFVCDILKGVLPCLAAYLIFDSTVMLYFAGFSVIAGHIFPVIFKFKGGKGIATMIGVFFVADPLLTLCVILIAAVCWMIFQYGSVSSFICVTTLTVVEGLKAKIMLPKNEEMIVSIILFAIFIITWFANRSNIERLLIGKESKVDLLKSVKKKIKNQ